MRRIQNGGCNVRQRGRYLRRVELLQPRRQHEHDGAVAVAHDVSAAVAVAEAVGAAWGAALAAAVHQLCRLRFDPEPALDAPFDHFAVLEQLALRQRVGLVAHAVAAGRTEKLLGESWRLFQTVSVLFENREDGAVAEEEEVKVLVAVRRRGRWRRRCVFAPPHSHATRSSSAFRPAVGRKTCVVKSTHTWASLLQ